MELVTSLGFGDLLDLAILALLLAVLVRMKQGKTPMTAETRAFLFDFIKNNTGIAWAFLAVLVFLGATLHILHDKNDDTLSIIETFKTLLATAAGWMGGLLTGRLMARNADHQELQPGVQGTQDTVVTTHKETPAPIPTVPDPAAPLVVEKILEPVTTKPQEPKP